jgi:hypothetical protein
MCNRQSARSECTKILNPRLFSNLSKIAGATTDTRPTLKKAVELCGTQRFAVSAKDLKIFTCILMADTGREQVI